MLQKDISKLIYFNWNGSLIQMTLKSDVTKFRLSGKMEQHTGLQYI